jgi:PD-(D/E)XK nuclease superfamily
MSEIYRLSQGHLNLLETCPPRFQKVYLQQLNTPSDPGQLERQEWGSQFHQLLQQRELGLPIDDLLEENEQLGYYLNALLQAAPEIAENVGEFNREAEHYRSLSLGNYLLTVIYDLILLESDRAVIFDWKTYLKPTDSAKLANNWQTRLYLYVLGETSHYPLNCLSMTYWFVQLPKAPEQITFNYNQKLHKRTGRDLKGLLKELDQYLLAYQKDASDFPHRQDCHLNCPYYHTQKRSSNFEHQEIPSIDDIPEINPFV